MRREIILMALTAPHAYPWDRKLKCNKSEINRVLDEVGLNNEQERRMAGWKLAIAIYKAGKKAKSIVEFKRLILDYCSHEKYINEEVLEAYMKMKYLNKEETVVVLNKFMNNQLSELEKKNNRRDITYWLVDVVSFCAMPEAMERNKSDYLTKAIKEIATTHFSMYQPLDWVGDIQSKKALHKENVIKLLQELLKKQQNIEDLLASYNEAKTDVIAEMASLASGESNLSDLFDVLGIGGEEETSQEAAPAQEELVEAVQEVATPQEEEVHEEVQVNQETQEVEVVKEEKEEQEMAQVEERVVESTKDPSGSRLIEGLSMMADELGYGVHKKGDYTLSAAEYEIMLQEKKLAEVKLFKQMAKLEQGAVLSELYNAYTHIQTISKENLEAILGNFFMALEEAGLQVIEEGTKVGEDLTVNTVDVLKDFIFSKPYNKDGKVKGTLLYKGWRYKNEQIMPKVVAPKMIEEEK